MYILLVALFPDMLPSGCMLLYLLCLGYGIVLWAALWHSQFQAYFSDGPDPLSGHLPLYLGLFSSMDSVDIYSFYSVCPLPIFSLCLVLFSVGTP